MPSASLAETLKFKLMPSVVVREPIVVSMGGWLPASLTVMVTRSVSTKAPSVALNVTLYVPDCVNVGVQLNVPVPSPLSTNVTSAGSAAPARAIVGRGKPLVVTVKLPGAPIGKVVAAALVMVGASLTASVKLCVALVPTPLSAVKVSA